MPELLDDDNLRNLEPSILEQMRRDIATSAQGDYRNLSVDDLHKLALITSILRGKGRGGPPKEPKKSSPKKSAAELLADI